jgi:hypothetical protein
MEIWIAVLPRILASSRRFATGGQGQAILHGKAFLDASVRNKPNQRSDHENGLADL